MATPVLDRKNLIERLIKGLDEAQTPLEEGGGPTTDRELRASFLRALIERVDDDYIVRHRMTTLRAQIRESFPWFTEAALAQGVVSRAFYPNLEKHGYDLDGLVVEVLMPHRPFISATVRFCLEDAGFKVRNHLRAVIPLTLDPDTPRIRAIDAPGGIPYSYTRWFLGPAAPLSAPGAPQPADASPPSDSAATPADLEALIAEIGRRLQRVNTLVADFPAMRDRLSRLRTAFAEHAQAATADGRDDLEDAEALLDWLEADNFIFLGLDDAEGHPSPSALGICREPMPSPLHPEVRAFLHGEPTDATNPWIRIFQTADSSIIHRRHKLLQVIIRAPGAPPTLVYGFFSHQAHQQPSRQIPIVRDILGRILRAEGISPGDYGNKALIAAFDLLPLEFLLEADEATLFEHLRLTRQANTRHSFFSQIVPARNGLSYHVFTVIPQRHYADSLRSKLQRTLAKGLHATEIIHRLHFSRFGAVHLYFHVTAPPLDAAAREQLQDELLSLGTPWFLHLRRSLEETHGETEGAEWHVRYAHAFEPDYREVTSIADATLDIDLLERARQDGRIHFALQPYPEDAQHAFLRIVSPRELLLTELLPVIDNFGITVVAQRAWRISPEAHPNPVHIITLRLQCGPDDLLSRQHQLVDALAAVFDGHIPNDTLNRLSLAVPLSWREVDIIRAYRNYSRQLAHGLSTRLVQEVLQQHATFTRQLIALFHLRFDPRTGLDLESRHVHEAALVAELHHYLDEVQGFEEDRILRIFLGFVRATLRTNFYQERSDNEHYLSFKFDSPQVPDMPEPRSRYEIWVNATHLEGIHLRGAKVARGGIRWSDRMGDFRSEVLSLMATQTQKNAVIVPSGAKGGFILKPPVENWAQARAQADERYKIYIRAILDLTDNIIDGRPIPPPRVVCHDAADAYVVVAADKGTAHLSDTANAISQSYQFWLGDAFASGGSIGYDHKAMGITARGAWKAVQRHFREFDIDPEKDPITCVGIGDMSGDVFGNGLLRSRSLRLIGAFNHRHIFFDPNPADPGAAWQERKRLYDTPRSAWTDYQRDLISPGGGVFERNAKSIPLNPAARARLGTDATQVTGERLIRLLLRADVDLLWNGGIGTYVKASSERHSDAQDPSNDRVRVNANTLQCRVIAEGGNLGLTQKARIEFSARGGRVNADAIDNSAGVDLSDHEVNLKTLLQPLVEDGSLPLDARHELIREHSESIARLVLVNNFDQALILALDARRSRENPWPFLHAMNWLRRRLGFSRTAEALPENTATIQKRAEVGRGFYRPELAKLLSFSKRDLAQSTLQSAPGSPEAMVTFARAYFPDALAARYPQAIQQHFLFADIAGTVITNKVLATAGVSLIPTLAMATEREPAEIAAAYLLAEELLDIAPTREALRRNTTRSTDTLYPALLRIEDAISHLSRAILWTFPSPVRLGQTPIPERARIIARLPFERLLVLLPDHKQRLLRDDHHTLCDAGLDPTAAAALASLPWRSHALWMAQIAPSHTELDDTDRVRTYFMAGFGSRALNLTQAIDTQGWPDPWDFIARGPIQRELFKTTVALAERLLPIGLDELENSDLAELALEIDEALGDRMPLSALSVLADRLRQRVNAFFPPTSAL